MQTISIPSYHIQKFSLSDVLEMMPGLVCQDKQKPDTCSQNLTEKIKSLSTLLSSFQPEIVNTNTLKEEIIKMRKDKKQFFIPYMMDRIRPNATRLNAKNKTLENVMYFNYVLGYYRVPSNYNGLVFRVGAYDEALRPLYKEFLTRNPKSKMQFESFIGCKHMQLAATDLDIVFSGVLIVYTKGEQRYLAVSPMSGSWYKIMESLVSDKDKKEAHFKLLNLLNVICTQYVLVQLKNHNAIHVETVNWHPTNMPSIQKSFIAEPVHEVPEWFKNTEINYTQCALFYSDINPESAELCTHDIPELLSMKCYMLPLEDNEPVSKKQKIDQASSGGCQKLSPSSSSQP